MLSPGLDDKVIRETCSSVADQLGVSLDSSFWRKREIDLNCRAGREGKLSEDEAAAAQSARIKFLSDQLGRKHDVEMLRKIASARWTTYKRHKAFLFLDSARVLRAAGLVDYESKIDQLADQLGIEPTAIASVKAFIAAEDADAYRAFCQSLDQLFAKPKSSSKKESVTKSTVKPKNR